MIRLRSKFIMDYYPDAKEIAENKAKLKIARKNYDEVIKNNGFELNRFDMYKKGLEIQKRGFPNRFNPFKEIILDPEYYFGFIPKLEEDDEE